MVGTVSGLLTRPRNSLAVMRARGEIKRFACHEKGGRLGFWVVVFQDETWTMEGRATWAWDSASDHGQAVNPGTYVVWAHSLVDGARQSVEKCLVAVRGR